MTNNIDTINERIDVLRGIAIIAVIIIHITSYFTKFTTFSPLVIILASIDIYAHFAVPLFILISGYVLGLRYSDNYKGAMSDKVSYVSQQL